MSKKTSKEALQKLFRRRMIADLNILYQTIETHSRMSVFRRLQELRYLSSYSHAGRYYTLADIPHFDDYGLWFHQGVGFSKFVTLRNTIIEMVNSSTTGMTHPELHNLLRVRVQDTLLNLVRTEQIKRKKDQGLYIYVNADVNRADKQLSQRRAYVQVTEPLPTASVIEVLVEAINAVGNQVSPAVVTARLKARSVTANIEQVKRVFVRYGINIEKKGQDRSRNTRRFEAVEQICQQQM